MPDAPDFPQAPTARSRDEGQLSSLQHAAPWRPTRLRETPSWLLLQTANLTNRLSSAAYERVGASHRQYVMLTALAEMEAATQAELGRHCHLDRSDVTGTLSELEELGLVARRENSKDRRQKIVTLTPEGLHRLSRISAALQSAQDELLRGMTVEERNALAHTLVTILDRHQAVPPGVK